MSYFYDEKYEGIEIQEDIRDMDFEYCIFKNCKINSITLRNCSFTDCVFENCIIGNNKFIVTTLEDCNFIKCNLLNVNWIEVLEEGSPLMPFAKLENCNLKYNSFFEMHLNKFDFKESTIVESEFYKCNMTNANLNRCNLMHTTFSSCNLFAADFINAKDYQIDIRTCNVEKAHFTLPDAMNLLSPLGVIIN